MKLRYSMLLAGGIALIGAPALADNTVDTPSQHTKQTASTSAAKRLQSPTGADSKSMTGTTDAAQPETASTDAKLRQESPTGADSKSMTGTTTEAQGTGSSEASTSAKARQELDAGGVDSVNSDISTQANPEKDESATHEMHEDMNEKE